MGRKMQPLNQTTLDVVTFGVAPPRTDAERTEAYIAELGRDAYERNRRHCNCGFGNTGPLRKHKPGCRWLL